MLDLKNFVVLFIYLSVVSLTCSYWLMLGVIHGQRFLGIHLEFMDGWMDDTLKRWMEC